MRLGFLNIVVDERQPSNSFTLLGRSEDGKLVAVHVKNVHVELEVKGSAAPPEPQGFQPLGALKRAFKQAALHRPFYGEYKRRSAALWVNFNGSDLANEETSALVRDCESCVAQLEDNLYGLRPQYSEEIGTARGTPVDLGDFNATAGRLRFQLWPNTMDSHGTMLMTAHLLSEEDLKWQRDHEAMLKTLDEK